MPRSWTTPTTATTKHRGRRQDGRLLFFHGMLLEDPVGLHVTWSDETGQTLSGEVLSAGPAVTVSETVYEARADGRWPRGRDIGAGVYVTTTVPLDIELDGSNVSVQVPAAQVRVLEGGHGE